MRVQKAGHHSDAGNVDGRAGRHRFTAASVRLGEQPEERCDGAEQREHGVPAEPRGFAREQELVDSPANQPDRRHRQTKRDRGPEQPMATGPVAAPPRDDNHAGHRRHDQRGHPEREEKVRVPVQQPSNEKVAHGVQDSARKPSHRQYFSAGQGAVSRIEVCFGQ